MFPHEWNRFRRNPTQRESQGRELRREGERCNRHVCGQGEPESEALLLDEGKAQKLLERRPEVRIGGQEGADEFSEMGTEILGGDGLVFTFDDFGHKSDRVAGIEGQAESTALIEQHAE